MKQKQIWLSKLALGTVQFGLDYGISNKTGQVEAKDVKSILEHARRQGLKTLDTAAAYGTSEEVLGDTIATSHFEIVSKFPANTSAETFDQLLDESLQKLKVPMLKAYLAHDFKTFKQADIRERLRHAKTEGKISQLGVSVYYPEEIVWLLENQIAFDIIQCPFNLFDQRFKAVFATLKKRNVEIHTRSSFLQGLFFLTPEALTGYFKPAKDKILAVQHFSHTHGVPLAALLLNYSLSQVDIDKVIFGVQSLKQLKQNLDAFTYFETIRKLQPELDGFAHLDEKILHPGHWP